LDTEMTRLTYAEFQDLLKTHEVVADTSADDRTMTDDHKRLKLAKNLPIPTEHEEQAAVIAWADNHPEAWVLYANVNGQYRPGQRPEPGLRTGIPDLFLPLARGGANGLYIELKRTKGGVVSEAQNFWIETLLNRGYWAVVCYGADEAIEAIIEYLGGTQPVTLRPKKGENNER
jgi:hypothetical protein